MSTTSEIFPSFTKLAHSLNMRGELGMFVNPHTCDCVTCVNYVSEHGGPQTPPPPSPPPSPPSLAHTRNLAGNFGMFVNPQTCACSGCSVYRAEQSTVPSLPPPPPLVDSNAADILLSMSRAAPVWSSPIALGRTESIVTPWLPESMTASGGIRLFPWDDEPSTAAQTTEAPQQDNAAIRTHLQDYQQVLRERQDELDHTGCRGHDEMAAQDMEWEELDRKISEIDDILATLGTE